MAFPSPRANMASTPSRTPSVGGMAYDWTPQGLENHAKTNVDLFKSRVGQTAPIEDHRLATLFEAAQCGDHVFIITHHLLCLKQWDPTVLVQTLKASDVSMQGMDVVHSLLNSGQ